MTGKTITGIIIILFTVLAMTSPALAASAGVSPANIIMNGTQGETYTINFAAVNTGNDTTDYSIYARGNITNWTFFNITKLTLAGKKAFPTDAQITIPTDLPDGTYKGDIIIKSVPNSAVGGNKISVAVNLPVTLIITIPETSVTTIMTSITIAIVVLLLGWTAFRLISRAAKKKEQTKDKPEGETS